MEGVRDEGGVAVAWQWWWWRRQPVTCQPRYTPFEVFPKKNDICGARWARSSRQWYAAARRTY